MSMPFYVTPDQLMKDRADFARKGIARGRALVACQWPDGILFVAENTSSTLRKVSEIYDRIAFAGVGKYNEFDRLRQAGVRAADSTGFQFSRADVSARNLADDYAQAMGQIFTHEQKPLEVEILVAEVGRTAADDKLFHLLYDGTVMDETRFSVLGGDAEAISERMTTRYAPDAGLDEALRACVAALSGPERTVPAEDLEVAVLDRDGERRSFRRLADNEVAGMLSG